MKRTKRIASVLLALVMALSLITTAFAAGETGSITIDNAVVGQTYTIYQILDLESYNKDSGATLTRLLPPGATLSTVLMSRVYM